MEIKPDSAENIVKFNAQVVADFIKDKNRNPQELIAISKELSSTIKVMADTLKYYSLRGEKPKLTFYEAG